MINAIRVFLGTCVDNITVLNYSVKVTLSVSTELQGVGEIMDEREEHTLTSKMNLDIYKKNMVSINRFVELLARQH